MSAYRRVIVGTLVLAVLIAAAAFLWAEGQVALFSGALLALGAGDIVATAYIGWLVYQDRRRPRSWLLLFLFTGALLVTAGLLPIDFLVVRGLLGYPPLPNAFGRLLSGMGLVLIGFVPLMKATLFYLVSHGSIERTTANRAEDEVARS